MHTWKLYLYKRAKQRDVSKYEYTYFVAVKMLIVKGGGID